MKADRMVQHVIRRIGFLILSGLCLVANVSVAQQAGSGDFQKTFISHFKQYLPAATQWCDVGGTVIRFSSDNQGNLNTDLRFVKEPRPEIKDALVESLKKTYTDLGWNENKDASYFLPVDYAFSNCGGNYEVTDEHVTRKKRKAMRIKEKPQWDKLRRKIFPATGDIELPYIRVSGPMF